MKLHHIGIVVKNIQESLGDLTQFLSFDSITLPSLISSQRVNVCFLKTNSVYIELIEPAEENSPISDFVKDGGGFHHLCFEVDDIHNEVEKMVKKCARLVGEPIEGFDNRLIAFLVLNMKNTNSNLIELVEAKK